MTGPGVTPQDLLSWAESLAGVARTGLGFTDSLYERERYEEVLAIAADMKAAAREEVRADDQVVEWMKLVGHGPAGYVTPKIAVGAIVANDLGEVLLVQRSDSGVWLYPTGWADIGYSPAEVARKEVAEETGIECEVLGLIGVLDGMRRGFTRIPLYSLLFSCRATGGEVAPHSLECLDAGFFPLHALPEPLAGSGNVWEHVAAVVAGETVVPYFDPPRATPWRVGD